MILTLTCVLLNYTNIQMQSPLFSSESFPIDFTVISYTHFFHFFFHQFYILHFCQFICVKKTVVLKLKDHVILINISDMTVLRMILQW